jgi:hypothetical protein
VWIWAFEMREDVFVLEFRVGEEVVVAGFGFGEERVLVWNLVLARVTYAYAEYVLPFPVDF